VSLAGIGVGPANQGKVTSVWL